MDNSDALSTHQITRVLQSRRETKPLYRGTFACNAIPPPPDPFTPWQCVVNTDPSWLPGQHWILFGSDSPGILNIFDSYGFDIMNFYNNSYIRAFIRNYFSMYEENQVQFQQQTSSVCGHYCIFVAVRRGQLGYYPENFRPLFPAVSAVENDAFVRHMASQCLDVHDVIPDDEEQSCVRMCDCLC